MCRVLDRNGRLALSVWNNVGIYNTAEADFSDVEVSVSRINVHLPQIALSNGALGAMSRPERTSERYASNVAFGGKADMRLCAAHVCF